MRRIASHLVSVLCVRQRVGCARILFPTSVHRSAGTTAFHPGQSLRHRHRCSYLFLQEANVHLGLLLMLFRMQGFRTMDSTRDNRSLLVSADGFLFQASIAWGVGRRPSVLQSFTKADPPTRVRKKQMFPFGTRPNPSSSMAGKMVAFRNRSECIVYPGLVWNLALSSTRSKRFVAQILMAS
jgi:hypothetical protein